MTETTERHDDRLATEQRYADQVALYIHAFGVKNSWSSRPPGRPIMGQPGGRGSLIVWNPKDPGPFPVVDSTHPENRYGTLALDRCLTAQNPQQAGARP